MTIGEPVKSLVESVLNDEWVIVSDTENTLLLNHRVHTLTFDFFKYGKAIRPAATEWMSSEEKRYVTEHLNDWWAMKRKELDTERRAEARNKFMCLVEGINV